MTPILYEKDEIDFTSQGLGSLVEIYDVDVAEQRNGLLQLTASYPVSGLRYADISVGRIILAKPNQRDDVHAFRIVSTELDISGYAVTIEADSITYDLTHNIVKHLNASGNGQAFMTALKNAVVNPSVFTFYSDIATSSTTSLNYVNPMESIMGTTGSFLQIWGGELKRENRRVAMFNRRGRDNVATFRLGKNISGLKYSVDISSLVTRIIPTKSVQNDDQTTTTLEGTPVDSQYINNYEQIYTLPLGFTDDTIKTVADLNAAAKGWFTKSANTGRDKPTVTIDIDVLSLQDSADYQDKFKNLESMSLTDTVTVYVPEYGVNVTAIVNELHYDPILDRVTKMTVGTAKQSFADSSRTQLSDLQDKIISVQNQADATAVSANGKSTNYYGSVEPSHPQEGDIWFWVDGDKTGVKVFVNGNWFEPVDSDTQEKIEAAVTDAVAQAKEHTDEVKRGLSSDIETAKSQAASLASTAEANAKSEATSLFSRAQNALSDAKTELTKSIASEASARNQAVSDLDTKAQGYADTAKADAISAATTADGFINKKIDDTASSITSTISQNKTDADGKIATAKSTATQALNELATKVSQTVYDAKTGQLQADLNTTTTTANTAKTDIVAIKSDNTKQDARMTTIESDADGTKTTVSNLQTDLGKANGSISTLQQRADGFDATVTKVDNLSTGDRNYILDTANPKTQTSNGKDNQGLDNQAPFYSPIKNWGIANGDYIISFDWTLKMALSSDMQASVIFNNSPWQQQFFTVKAGQLTGHVDLKFKLNPGILTATKDVTGLSFLIMSQMASGNTVTYSNLFMKSGTISTTWTPALEDLSGATAKAQLTADNAALNLSKYQTDADGRISKAQAGVEANANAITQKVSQTDYDKKTGDLTTAVSKAQTTADGVVTTVSNYQTSNDKRVKAAESAISQNADAIALKVSKSDYDNNNSQLNTRFTKVEATANGASTTVGKLQTAVNNLGQVNQLFNTEFSPDLQGWSSSNLSNYLDYIDIKGVYNRSHVLHYNGGTAARLDIQSQKIKIENPAQTFSISVLVKGTVGISVVGYKSDSDVAFSSWYTATNVDSKYSDWTLLTFNNKSIISGSTAAITSIAFNITSFGTEFWLSEPMLVFSDHVGTYAQGNYNNNAALAQVKITADSISNFVRDSSGNISSTFQTALSKMSIITGSTLASSIQKQTATQITSALTDNNGKIISLINQDSSGVQIAGKNIVLDGNTTVTGDFYAKGGNFKNLNASNLTVGTLNGSQVNITNINANNIVSGAISGANLNINLNTGSVVFQKGRINSSDYTTDINIDQGYISTANGDTRALLTQGKLQLIDPTLFSPQTTPYLEISNHSSLFSGMSTLIKARDSLTVSINGHDDRAYDIPLSTTEKFVGLNIGEYKDKLTPTKIGGAEQGVIISGGALFDNNGIKSSPYIYVGSDSAGGSPNGDRIYLNGKAVHIPSAYTTTWSSSANVYVAWDGSLYRASSAKKYKRDIKHNVPLSDSKKLLEIPLSTWVDKRQYREKNDETRYFGMIAEDLRDAGLEYLVQYGEDNEVEGINYDRVALLLIPLVKELKERIEELESEGK